MVSSRPARLDCLRTIVWAQGRMLLHSYTRSPLVLVSVLLLLACFAPWVGIISVWASSAFRGWEPGPARELLHVLLFAVWALWVGLPLYGFSVSETMGTYNLRVFPVSSLLVFLGRCVSALIDVPVLFLVPLYLAALLGYCSHSFWGFWAGVVSLGMLTTNFVSGGLLLSALMRLFPRARGAFALLWLLVAIAIVPGIWLLLRKFFAPQALILSREFLGALGLSRFLSFTPPGLAANLCIAFREGAVINSLASFAGLAVTTVLFFLAGSWLTERADLGVETSSRPSAQEVPASRPGRLKNLLQRAFSPSLWGVMSKEAALFRRDPELRLYLIVIPALVVPLLLVWRLFGEVVPPAQVGASTTLVWVALVGSSGLLFNLFGYDREGLASLFLSSAARQRILAGANLVVCLFVFFEVTVVSLFAWFFFEQWEYWPQTLLALLVLLPVLATIGNFCSILCPYYVMRDRRGLHQAGMARVWLWGFTSLLAMGFGFLLAMPAVLAVTVLPLFWGRGSLWWVVPGTLVYSLGLYYLSLRYGARLLLAREAEILRRCSAPGGERG